MVSLAVKTLDVSKKEAIKKVLSLLTTNRKPHREGLADSPFPITILYIVLDDVVRCYPPITHQVRRAVKIANLKVVNLTSVVTTKQTYIFKKLVGPIKHDRTHKLSKD